MNVVRTLVALILLLGLSACVGLPDDGPVRTAPRAEQPGLDEGIPFAPRSPQRGETAPEIVRHFLDAMMANPIQLSTAREFLTEDAAEAWRPEERTITYPGPINPVGEFTVTVDLDGAQWLNARGRWQGDLPADQRRLEIRMGREDGEWRISDVPDAMIVADSWFQDRFRQVSLYFFDPSAEILVPEPVYVPRGGQLPTSLVRGLLRGPPAPGATVSFFPRGAALDDVSVPVSDGVADVALRGDVARTSPESLDLMAAQLAWTLRQDPSVASVRVTIGGAPITLPGGETEFGVSDGEQFDPRGNRAVTDVYGLEKGRLVWFAAGESYPVAGPFGAASYGVGAVSVDLTGDSVAAVTRNGNRLLLGSTDGDATQTPRTVIADGTDLAHPAWDAAGRLWLLDRFAGRARVQVFVDGRLRPVRIPGVTGLPVVDLLVSRDGTRLIAAIDRASGDVVVESRLIWSTRGVRASTARTIDRGVGADVTVRDLGWRSPTEVLVLASLTRRLSEVRTVPVDGSPGGDGGSPRSELIRSDVRRLVSSPAPDAQAWVVAADGTVIPLAPFTSEDAPPTGVSALTYAG